MPNLKTIRKHKKDYCLGKKGSYQKMRSACKRYVDSMANKAKTGSKTKTKQKARNEAMKIISGSCKLK